jgi:hypothetical protein
MKYKEFQTLVESKLVNRAFTIQRKFIDVFFYSMLSMGISDNDIRAYMIDSMLSFYEKHCVGKEHIDIKTLKSSWKEQLEQAIVEKSILLLSEPLKTSKNNSKKQRRLDSIARLIALPDEITPCFAVTLFDNQLVIALNTPSLDHTQPIDKLIINRVGALRDFFRQMISNELNEATSKLQAKKLIDIINNNGGMCSSLAKKEQRKPSRKTLKDALVEAALKVALSLRTMDVFSEEEKLVLLDGEVTILLPNTDLEILLRGSVHAEQLIKQYVLKHLGDRDDDVHIGISKLSCVDCDRVLSRHSFFKYRGSHGIIFSQVIDLEEKNIFPHLTKTKLIGNPYPTDSDSDPEFDEEVCSSPTNERKMD